MSLFRYTPSQWTDVSLSIYLRRPLLFALIAGSLQSGSRASLWTVLGRLLRLRVNRAERYLSLTLTATIGVCLPLGLFFLGLPLLVKCLTVGRFAVLYEEAPALISTFHLVLLGRIYHLWTREPLYNVCPWRTIEWYLLCPLLRLLSSVASWPVFCVWLSIVTHT